MKRFLLRGWSLSRISRAGLCDSPFTVTKANEQSPAPKPTYPLTDANSPPMLATPLTQVPSDFPLKIRYPTSQNGAEKDSQVTTLSNGLRVATQNTFGQFCTVGVVVDAGSRYEVNYPSGVSHFLEKLAFQGTPKYPTRDDVLHALENVGGICDAQTGRDVIIYGTSSDIRGVDTAVDVLSDCILQPKLDVAEIEAAKMAVTAELETLDMSPTHDTKLAEWAHQAAYSNNTLGLPRICPTDNINQIDRTILLNYLNSQFTPERMVLCGVGMEHSKLVELAEKNFLQKQPVWKGDPSLQPTKYDADISVAQYTGGDKRITKDLSKISLGPNPLPNLAHVVLAFESFSHADSENFVPLCVLASLMGGGGSFSAGGPGKGMYSRLYLNVLNRYFWVHHAQAMNVSYSDTGLFYVLGSADPQSLHLLVDVLSRELLAMACARYNDVEVERAKAQLQSLLLMNLEQRPVTFEDVGRQVLFHGKRRSPKLYYEDIGKVTAADLQRVADHLLSSRLTLVGFGDLAKLPPHAEVQKVFAERSSVYKNQRQGSIFRFFG